MDRRACLTPTSLRAGILVSFNIYTFAPKKRGRRPLWVKTGATVGRLLPVSSQMLTNVQSFFHQKTSDEFIFIFILYIIIWQQLWKSESTRKQSSKQTAHIHRTNISKVTDCKVTPYQCMCNTVKLGTSKVSTKTWYITQCISIRQGCQILVGHVTENTTKEIIRIHKSQQKFLLWYSLYYRSHRTLKTVLHYQVKYLSHFCSILYFMLVWVFGL